MVSVNSLYQKGTFTMELYFLGTGAGVPSKQRNVTAIALNLLQECHAWWLFDCGEGTQQQILHSPVKLNRVNHIFITHLHGDHIYGLPGVLASRSFQGGTSTLTVHGPVGIEAYLEVSLQTSRTHLTYPLNIHEIVDSGPVIEEALFTVWADWLDHGVPSLGYRVEEHQRTGALLPERIGAYGVPPGPAYRTLKSGQSVVAPDGHVIHPAEVTAPPIPGRVVTILGDTRPCQSAVTLARSADVLVHEATFAGAKAELAHQYNHSTAVDAATTARAAEVRTLVLTHISSRYADDDLGPLQSEARAIFPNVYIASDHGVIPIPLPS